MSVILRTLQARRRRMRRRVLPFPGAQRLEKREIFPFRDFWLILLDLRLRPQRKIIVMFLHVVKLQIEENQIR